MVNRREQGADRHSASGHDHAAYEWGRLKDIDPKVKVLLTSGYSINGQVTEILDIGSRLQWFYSAVLQNERIITRTLSY